jgi:hypothetical protein
MPPIAILTSSSTSSLNFFHGAKDMTDTVNPFLLPIFSQKAFSSNFILGNWISVSVCLVPYIVLPALQKIPSNKETRSFLSINLHHLRIQHNKREAVATPDVRTHPEVFQIFTLHEKRYAFRKIRPFSELNSRICHEIIYRSLLILRSSLCSNDVH